MKFKPVCAGCALSAAELEGDWAQARDIGKVRLGEHCLFFARFAGAACLPYRQVARVWLRQEEVNANMCCGRVSLDQFYLMVQTTDGQTLRGQVLDKDCGKAALAHTAARSPEAQVGPPPT